MKNHSYWQPKLLTMLRKALNYYLPIWDFLYILQLEEYDVSRYLVQVRLRLFKRNFEVRDALQYTARAKMVFALAVLFVWLLVSYAAGNVVMLLLVLGTIPLTTPFILAIASYAVQVPVSLQKRHTLSKTGSYFSRNYPDTKIVGITGSFGKTTAKYLAQHVLQYDYRVAIIPDNINTSLGIAHYLLSGKIPTNSDLLIVEMGAYKRGDIREIATFLPPDYAIMTIYGDQHLERFGSHENVVHGKSEIFTTHQKTRCYMSTADVAKAAALEIPAEQVVSVAVPSDQKATPFLVSQLAYDLGVSEASIAKSLDTFIPPDRRNNVIEREGVTIIDNSYNISPMVAKTMLLEAAEQAKKAKKSLVVMTGGIGEQGIHTAKVNQRLAELLNEHADRVIINDTTFAQSMLKTIAIPYEIVRLRTEVTDHPSDWLDGRKEILLWLTGHGDLAYV